MSSKNYVTISIKAAALYDVALLLPFAFPGLVTVVLAQLRRLHTSLELSGHFPECSPFHLLFINIMASISVVWGALRLRDPRREFGLYDCVMRGLIATTILYYVAFSGVSSLLWIFVVGELFWACVQLAPQFTSRSWASQTDAVTKV